MSDERAAVNNIGSESADPHADKPYDASDPKQVNEARRRAGRKKVDSDAVMRGLMDLYEGRRWVYEQLVFCNTFGNAFTPGSPDSTAFSLGMQNVGKMLLDQISRAAPDRYMTMLSESKE